MPIWVIAAGLSVGCGGDIYGERIGLSGEVTLDGKPLEEGRIVFIPLDATAGAPGATAASAGGKYTIPTVAGLGRTRYRVQIHRDRKTGRRVPDYDGAPGDTREEILESLPPEYNSRSRLEADLSSGTIAFHFPLKSKPDTR